MSALPYPPVFGKAGATGHFRGLVPDPGGSAHTPAYVLLDSATFAKLVGAKGDLLTTDGTNLNQLAVGSDGQVLTAASGQTNGIQWQTPGNSPVLASSCNLKILNNSVTPNTKIDLQVGPYGSAFEVVAENSSQVALRLRSTSTITINAGATGANGLDTGTQAASTWYYIYAIYNGTTVAGLLSTSSTAPTLPGGYTYSALIGAVYSDVSVHFQSFVQSGKRVWTPPQNVFTSVGPASANTYQSRSLSTFVPPIADSWSGRGGSTGSTFAACFAVAGDANGTGEKAFMLNQSTSSYKSTFACAAFDNIPLLTSQTMYWQSLVTNAITLIDLTGWTYP